MRIRLPRKLHRRIKRIAAGNNETMADFARRQISRIPVMPILSPDLIDTSIPLSKEHVDRLDGLASSIGITRTAAIQIVLAEAANEEQ